MCCSFNMFVWLVVYFLFSLPMDLFEVALRSCIQKNILGNKCRGVNGSFFKYDVLGLAFQRLIGEGKGSGEHREGKEPGGRMSHVSKVTGCWKDPVVPGQLCVF